MTFDDLIEVHAKICSLPYVAEKVEDWSPITSAGGDCDSYATAMVEALHQRGWPPNAVRLATCYVEPSAGGGYHAVCLADLSEQTWVLDNRQPCPIEWQLLPYRWDEIQVAGTQGWETR